MNIVKFENLRQESKITFLNGLLSLYKFKSILWELKFLKLPILAFYKYHYSNKKYKSILLFSKPKIKKRIEDECLFHIVNQSPQEYDNIVFIRSGLGETYLLNIYLKQILESLNIELENTCFIGLRDTFKEIFHQYNPNVIYKKIDLNWDYLCLSCDKQKYQYNGKNIYFYIEKNYIYNLMNNYKNSTNNTHFVSNICNFFNINKNSAQIAKYVPSISERDKAITYLYKNNININNFIFISKNAISIENFSDAFWNDLEHYLKLKGYDIVYNQNEFSITEAKVIASYSKAIIALRSGFLETLSELDKKFYILNTALTMNNINAERIKKLYSLKFYPNVKQENIFEYDNETMDENEILLDILKGV